MLRSSQNKPLNDDAYIQWIYDTYKMTMFYTANKYIKDQSTCEDVIHDGIIKLLEKIDVVRSMEGSALTGYIVATIRNISIDYLRRQAVQQAHTITIQEEDWNSMLAHEISPDEAILLKEKGARLLDVLQKLPPTEFLLLQGRYMLDYTDAELAAQLGCKESTIRMKLTRARRHALALLHETNWEGDEDHDEARTTTGTV